MRDGQNMFFDWRAEHDKHVHLRTVTRPCCPCEVIRRYVVFVPGLGDCAWVFFSFFQVCGPREFGGGVYFFRKLAFACMWWCRIQWC